MNWDFTIGFLVGFAAAIWLLHRLGTKRGDQAKEPPSQPQLDLSEVITILQYIEMVQSLKNAKGLAKRALFILDK